MELAFPYVDFSRLQALVKVYIVSKCDAEHIIGPVFPY